MARRGDSIKSISILGGLSSDDAFLFFVNIRWRFITDSLSVGEDEVSFGVGVIISLIPFSLGGNFQYKSTHPRVITRKEEICNESIIL
jgi:hypothetical protein